MWGEHIAAPAVAPWANGARFWANVVGDRRWANIVGDGFPLWHAPCHAAKFFSDCPQVIAIQPIGIKRATDLRNAISAKSVGMPGAIVRHSDRGDARELR